MSHALVLEDDLRTAYEIVEVACTGGVKSFTIATSAEEAMAAAATTLPTIILSDVDLKEGGTGPDICAAIRAEFGEIPVNFITGDPDRCSNSGYASAILTKPITANQLLAIIRVVNTFN